MDNGDRQEIEGLFGVLKRKYGMDTLFTKLKENQMLNIVFFSHRSEYRKICKRKRNNFFFTNWINLFCEYL